MYIPGQRTIWEGWFSPSALWDPGFKLAGRLSSLSCQAILLGLFLPLNGCQFCSGLLWPSILAESVDMAVVSTCSPADLRPVGSLTTGPPPPHGFSSFCLSCVTLFQRTTIDSPQSGNGQQTKVTVQRKPIWTNQWVYWGYWEEYGWRVTGTRLAPRQTHHWKATPNEWQLELSAWLLGIKVGQSVSSRLMDWSLFQQALLLSSIFSGTYCIYKLGGKGGLSIW